MEPFSLSTLGIAVLIFCLQATTITLGSLRVMLLVRGNRPAAGGIALMESFVWVYSAGQVLTDLGNPYKVVAYVCGFATGTMLGMTVERWLALGKALLRIVAPVDSPQVVDVLREHGYRATVINASGRDGDVRITFCVIPRKRIPEVEQIISRTNPRAFVTVEDTRTLTVSKAHRMVPQGAIVTLSEGLGSVRGVPGARGGK